VSPKAALSNLPERNPFFIGRERVLTQLREALVAQELAVLSETVPVSPRTTHNLPFRPNPAFTGRADELKKLHERFQKRVDVAVTQLVVVHGLGGVGKTQLAIEYAWKYLGDYDAVLWVKADSLEALDGGLLAELASLLGLPEAAKPEQIMQTQAILGWLHGHERWLLIADNADTELAARAVRDRFSPNLRGAILVTSRLRRWPVTMPDLPLNVLSEEDAIRYLLDRVAKENHNAGSEGSAQSLAHELGHLPLALEQAASFIVEMHWSFAKYQEQFQNARPELLSEHREGGTRYPVSIARTWSITLERLSPLSRMLLRLAAWYAPDLIPRGVFSADHNVVEEVGEEVTVSDLAIEKALGELDRFSLVHLTSETVSVHRLLQAVEQDSLIGDEHKRWLEWAARLFNAFAPGESWDVRSWGIWVSLVPHAESLLEHMKRYGVDTRQVALMADQFASFLWARAAYAKAEPFYQRALAIREKVLGLEHPDVAWTLNGLACLNMDLGHYAEAEPLLERALAIRKKAGPEHRDVAETLHDSAALYCEQGQYAKAEPFYKRAWEIWEKALGTEHSDGAWSLNGLARLYDAQGEYAKAEPLYEQALAIRQKALGPEHPDVATSLNDMAWLYVTLGQYAKAEPLHERALAIREKTLGPDHPDVATSRNNLAALYWDQGQYAKAEPLYQRALVIFEKALGLDHPDVATSLNNLAGLYRVRGQYAKAEPLFNRALAIRENTLGLDHPDVATSLNNLALLYVDQGKRAKAEPLYQRALATREKALGPEHPAVAAILNNLAEFWQAEGEDEKAEPLYQRALTIFEKALNPEHPHVATILNSLAGLYKSQGRYTKAETHYQRALATREKALRPEHPDVAASLEDYAVLLRSINSRFCWDAASIVI
jgi:tetratricopeptide (TPR) repeat protein